MNSREIAEYANKEHRHVMEAIRTMEPSWEKVNGSKFRLVEYRDAKGEMRPMYELSKTECLYIATKFNDEARAKLIIRWEELEKQNSLDFTNPDTVLMLAQNWKKSEEERKRLLAINEHKEKQIQVLSPKAALMDRVMDSGTMIDIGQAAKVLSLPFGRNTLFQKLREKGIFFKNRNEPLQIYVDNGCFILKQKNIERDNHSPFVVMKVLVTQKGLAYLAKIFQVVPQQKELMPIQ